MTPTRREFIKGIGIAIGSLVMARCVPMGGGDDTPRGHLRNCWLRFDWLTQEAQDWDDHERGEGALDQLIADHRAALDDLIAAGELDPSIADQVQVAFSEAAYHVWRSNCGMTCYEPVLINYTPTSADQLVRQADFLAEIADSGDLDQNTVAQAQAAVERDIAFLALSNEEIQSLYDELREAAGDTYNFPSFDELDLEITPEAAEAACFLVELLLEK